MPKKENNKIFYLIIYIILGLIIFGYFISRKERIELEKSSQYTTGVIIKKYEVSKRGFQIRYKYSVDDVFYEKNQDLTIKKNLIKLGDEFEVKYANKNPSNSELNFKKKIINE